MPVWRQHLGLLCIILAGEAVFSLPFHIPRFFRPSVLDAFGISNTALGDAFVTAEIFLRMIGAGAEPRTQILGGDFLDPYFENEKLQNFAAEV